MREEEKILATKGGFTAAIGFCDLVADASQQEPCFCPTAPSLAMSG